MNAIEAAIKQTMAIAESDQLVARFKILCFEQASFVIDHLKLGGSAIVDVTEMDVDQAQRVVDFLAGACYGIDCPETVCTSRNLSHCVFAFGDPEDLQEFYAEEPDKVVYVDFGGGYG